MCGIVGYLGNKDASKILIEGLSKLEYRGYDSAGIAILKNEELSVQKRKGRLANLEEKLDSHIITQTRQTIAILISVIITFLSVLGSVYVVTLKSAHQEQKSETAQLLCEIVEIMKKGG